MLKQNNWIFHLCRFISPAGKHNLLELSVGEMSEETAEIKTVTHTGIREFLREITGRQRTVIVTTVQGIRMYPQHLIRTNEKNGICRRDVKGRKHESLFVGQ